MDDILNTTQNHSIFIIKNTLGWWRGILKGKEGVFPSNFVQVIEANIPPILPPDTSKPSSIIAAQQNKLGSLFAGKSSKPTSLSTNSLNSNHSNNSNNNILTSSSNSNSIMNSNTQDTSAAGLSYPIPGGMLPPVGGTPPGNSAEDGSGERRPKPIRGVGFGDIFAANAGTGGAKLRLPGGMNATERSSTMQSSTLSKSIPKKPPPPTPTSVNNDATNGNTAAPALPPKPANQFSSHGNSLQHSRMLPTPHGHQSMTTNSSPQSQSMMSSLQQMPSAGKPRERARVIYAYDAQNGDELTLAVDDIINVLDKDIEDVGWWKGELRGKIGVFPDNFVQLIEELDLPPAVSGSDTVNPDGSWITNNRNSNTSLPSGQPTSGADGFIGAGVAAGRLKSVFATTPKGFSKELENNLEKQQQHNSNSAVSFLSLKRNKLSSGPAVQHDPSEEGIETASASAKTSGSSDLTGSGEAQSPTKLNHMTVNRAKGPTRRPPSNFLNKKSSLDQSPPSLPGKTNGRLSEGAGASLTSNSTSQTNHDTPPLSSLPPVPPSSSTVTAGAPISSSVLSAQQATSNMSSSLLGSRMSAPVTTDSGGVFKSSSSLENIVDEPSVGRLHNNNVTPSSNSNHHATPKTTQRASQSVMSATGGQDKDTTKTPAWMVELRNKKAATENKRDTPSLVDNSKRVIEREISPVKGQSGQEVGSTSAPIEATITSNGSSSGGDQNGSTLTPTINTTKQPSVAGHQLAQNSNNSSVTQKTNTNNNNNHPHHHNQLGTATTATSSVDIAQLAKQISKDVTGEISELREEVRMLRDDLKEMGELRDAVNSMKIELKACQSATENQKRYIKDLVNNLADERKKIAAMQTELERNLK